MSNGLRFLSMLIALASLGLQSAHADWVEARSENFVFVADISEKRAKETVEEMERYRATVFRLLGLPLETEIIPVKIYGVPNQREMERTFGGGLGGFYTADRDGPTFAVNMAGGSLSGSVRNVLCHEYVHHITGTYTSRIYPRWYNEGYAEYLASMVFHADDGGDGFKVQLGMPQQGRGQTLESFNNWYSWDKTFREILEYPWAEDKGRTRGRNASLYYAQSWATAHYMHSVSGWGDKLENYLAALNAPDAPDDIFKQSFGETPDQIGAKVKEYVEENDFLSLMVPMEDFQLPQVVTRELSDGEAAFWRGEVVRWVAPDEEEAADLLFDRYEDAREKRGPRSEIYASEALVASGMGRHDEARELAKKALGVAPEDSRALQVAGFVRLADYRDEETPADAEQMKEAREFLFRAMMANPDNLAAHHYYAASFADTEETPDAQALSSAIESAVYFRGRQFVDDNMRLAEVLALGGQIDAARALYKKASIWGSAEKREEARRALEKLEN